MLLTHKLWKKLGPRGLTEQPLGTDSLVLLHGLGGTGGLWRPVAASLENDFSVLAPDLRGHGGSRLERPVSSQGLGDYNPLEYGRDVIETMGELGFEPAWLIGHSMGVRTACAAAHLNPDSVRGLILVDLGLSGGAPERRLRGLLGSFLQKLPEDFPDHTRARDFLSKECGDPAIANYLLAVASSSPSGEGRISFPFDREALLKTLEAASRLPPAFLLDWLEPLGKRGMPILALRGETSKAWLREEFERERERFRPYPSVRFEEVEGAGHGLPFEKRKEFVARVRDFVTLPRP
jgi:esterase